MSATEHRLHEVRPAADAHIAECVCGRAFLRGLQRDALASLDRHVRSFDRQVPVISDEPGLFGGEP